MESKCQLARQIDAGKHEEALAYVRTGNGMALAKTLANIFDDLDMKIEREFKDADLSQAEKQTKIM